MSYIKFEKQQVVNLEFVLNREVIRTNRGGAFACQNIVGKALPKAFEKRYPNGFTAKEHCMQWVTPVGVPVVNWAEGSQLKRVSINSMGVTVIQLTVRDNKYNTRAASNGVVPNFVHSMDGAHLCMTINDFEGSILPIHDSFATHACDVTAMHSVLRETFITLYSEYDINSFLEYNAIVKEDFCPPEQGTLNLNLVRSARFMFC